MARDQLRDKGWWVWLEVKREGDMDVAEGRGMRVIFYFVFIQRVSNWHHAHTHQRHRSYPQQPHPLPPLKQPHPLPPQ